MSLAASPQQRAQIIADTRRLLDWLEANPDVPVWHYGVELQYGPSDGRPGVARIAEQIGEQPEPITTGAYRVTKRFGLATYVASAQPQRKQERRPAA